MSIPEDSELTLEIAHVLLIDVVGYSKLLVDGQIEVLEKLNQVVRETAHFRSAEAKGKLMRLPTGDGMALLFLESPEDPLRCALEISEACKAYPQIQLRMGVHTGPIKEVKDVNDRSNFAGTGINLAQRVLDCGDAGHILVSQRVAEDLRSYRQWNSWLHDLGLCEVKHGVELHLYNLCKDDLGNPAIPNVISRQHRRTQRWRRSATRWVAGSPGRKAILGAGLIAIALALFASVWFSLHRAAAVIDKGIAVLPFSNSSDDSSNAYFVNGVQDEILIDLSKVYDLKVISRASVMQFKAGTERNLVAIANALGVSHLLEGSVQKVKNRVRVHVRLIAGATGRNIWAEHYDRDLADVFAIQTEIAKQIVAQLKLQLSPELQATIEKPPTKDFAAYDLYVRAKGLIYGSILSARGREDLIEAVQLLTQAVERDPEFFLAYYQIAQAHDQLYSRFEQTPGRLALAETALQTLRSLRPDSGETHLASGRHSYLVYRDNARARAELELARQTLPNEPDVPLFIGYIDRREGRWEDSTRNLQRALELDPQNPQNAPLILQQLSLSYAQLHRFPEMAAMLDRALTLDPANLPLRAQRAAVELDWRADIRPLHAVVESAVRDDPAGAATIADLWMDLAICERDEKNAARALNFLGENGCVVERIPFPRSWCEGMAARIRDDQEAARAAFSKARAEAESLVRAQPQDGGGACVLGMANAALGNKEEAISYGRRAVELLPVSKDAANGPLVIGYLAIIYAWVGEKDLALDQLTEAIKIPTYWSYGNLRLHPYWDPLRGDARFDAIVESLAPK